MATTNFPVAYELSIDQMKELGLYISHPKSPEETDTPFSEPGMSLINPDGKDQLINISNMPFNSSGPEELIEALEWIQEINYTIRGTYE